MVKPDARLGDDAPDHRLTSLVTASEERLPPQPGMKAEKAPARPPAATTRMSSAEATSGRSFVSSPGWIRSEEHTSELQSRSDLVCRLLLEKKKNLRLHVARQ